MEILFLLAVVLALFVPQLLLARKQKAAQQKILEFQASLRPGQRVVTAGGFHLTVVEVADQTIQAELAPDVVVTLERSVVMRGEQPDGDPLETAAFAEDEPTDSSVAPAQPSRETTATETTSLPQQPKAEETNLAQPSTHNAPQGEAKPLRSEPREL